MFVIKFFKASIDADNACLMQLQLNFFVLKPPGVLIYYYFHEPVKQISIQKAKVFCFFHEFLLYTWDEFSAVDEIIGDAVK